MTEPRFPDITVHLTEHLGKPVAMVAMVRRALQKAGHHTDAARFTEEGLAAEEADILKVAAAYVRVE